MIAKTTNQTAPAIILPAHDQSGETDLVERMAAISPVHTEALCVEMIENGDFSFATRLAEADIAHADMLAVCDALMRVDPPQWSIAKQWWDNACGSDAIPPTQGEQLARVIMDGRWGLARLLIREGAGLAERIAWPESTLQSIPKLRLLTGSTYMDDSIEAFSPLGLAMIDDNLIAKYLRGAAPEMQPLFAAGRFDHVPFIVETRLYGELNAVAVMAMRADPEALATFLDLVDTGAPAARQGLLEGFQTMLKLARKSVFQSELTPQKCTALAAVLLEKGLRLGQAEIDEFNRSFTSPVDLVLLTAQMDASARKVHALHQLHEGGVRLDVCDAKRNTLLHLAAEQGDAALARFCLEAGLPAETKNARQWTAKAVARNKGQTEVLGLLLANEAREQMAQMMAGVPAVRP